MSQTTMNRQTKSSFSHSISADPQQTRSRPNRASTLNTKRIISKIGSILTRQTEDPEESSSESDEGLYSSQEFDAPSQRDGDESTDRIVSVESAHKAVKVSKSSADFAKSASRLINTYDDVGFQRVESSQRNRRHQLLDNYSMMQWVEWQKQGLWSTTAARKGKSTTRQPVTPMVDMQACTGDMVLEDLIKQDEEEHRENRSPVSYSDDADVRTWSDENTPLHDICRQEGYKELVKRLKTEPYEKVTHKIGPRGTSVVARQKFVPLHEVSQPNFVGQLPLHVAAQTVRHIEERDGMLRRVEDFHQAAPDLVTALCTGRDPRTGEKIFCVERDEAGYVMNCMHQDSVGMTPLHCACACGSSTSFEVVCRLLEANPKAASVRDADGFYPLDIVCMSPYRGASDILKVLLRAYPAAACVSSDAEREIDKDWNDCFDMVDPTDPLQEDHPGLSSRYVESVLKCFPDGIDAGTESRPPEKKNTPTHTQMRTLDLRYLLMQRILVQKMVFGVASAYRAGNISVPGRLVYLSFRELRDRAASDMPRLLEIKSFRFLIKGGIWRPFFKDKMKALKASESDPSDADAEYRPPTRGQLRDLGKDESLEDYVMRKFTEFDADGSGKLDHNEVLEGFKKLGIPLTRHETVKLIFESDTEGLGYLDLSDFGRVIKEISQVHDMSMALQERWEKSPQHKALDEGLFLCVPTKTQVETKKIIACVNAANIQDPSAALVSKLPYKAQDCFLSDELDRRKSSRKGSIEAPGFIDSSQLHKKLRTPDQCLARFLRLPLHFACANSSNPEVGVMVRDLLSTFAGAAHLRDAKGRLPLHVACSNESYACVCAVRLLLKEYPEGAQMVDNDGELPLHLCLRNNHGDGALECVVALLEVFKEAAQVASGYAVRFNSRALELPVHIALSNYSVDSDKIVAKLLNAYPQVLSHTDSAGATLLHKFVWVKHPSPEEALKALEKDRGISGHLRCPAGTSKEARNTYDPLLMLEAIVSRAKRYHPQSLYSRMPLSPYSRLETLSDSPHEIIARYFEMLHAADNFGGMPLHYLCQQGGPCSRAIAQALLRLHPSAAFMQDQNDNTPLHMALGSRNTSCTEVIAATPSAKLFSVSNLKKHIPAEVPGAWQARHIFKIPTAFGILNHVVQSLSSSLLVALTAYLSWWYYQEGKQELCVLSVLPLFSISITASLLDIKHAWKARGSMHGWLNKIELLILAILNWGQLRVPVAGLLLSFPLRNKTSTRSRTSSAGAGFVNTSYWLDQNRHLDVFMMLKRFEMPLVVFYLSILHAYAILTTENEPQTMLGYQISCTIVCIFTMAHSGLNQESFRFWYDAANPKMHRYEIITSFCLRSVEAISRWSGYTLLCHAYGVSAIVVTASAEVGIMMLCGGSLFDFQRSPQKFVDAASREIFDLCGVYHGFVKGSTSASEGEGAALMGKGNAREASIKFVFQKCVSGAMLGVAFERLNRSGKPLDFINIGSNTIRVFLAGIVTIVASLLLFLVRVELHRMRRVQKSSRLKNSKLASWGIPLFEETSHDFLSDINEELEYCRFLPGDHIIRKGESDHCMHFLASGVAFLFSSKSGRVPSKYDPMHGIEDALTNLEHGRKAACHVFRETALGELGLLCRTERDVTVVARTECETLAITYQAFTKLLAKFPNDAVVVECNAQRIVSHHSDKKLLLLELRRTALSWANEGSKKTRHISKEYVSLERGRMPVLPFSSAPTGTVFGLLVLEETKKWGLVLVEGLRFDIANLLQIQGRNVLLDVDDSMQSSSLRVTACKIGIFECTELSLTGQRRPPPKALMALLENFVAKQSARKSAGHNPTKTYLGLVKRVLPSTGPVEATVRNHGVGGGAESAGCGRAQTEPASAELTLSQIGGDQS